MINKSHYSLALLLIIITSSYAGVGGKFAGKVIDKNGNPLIGVNIIIENTDLGTISDNQGNYYFLNIPPGHYNIRFMMIGYKTVIHEDIIIMSDFTTKLAVGMEQTVISGEEVTVTASKPLIQKDATSSIKVIDSENIVDMPVVDFKDVLATQAGFTEDASGGIHVRGGRTKEILYMIDGMVVKDPLQGDYSGSVNQNAIQEMTIISGTFNAEYGQAMSSVVNIVTKEGGDEFSGKLEFISPQINDSPYHSDGAFKAVSDESYVWTDLRKPLFNYLETNLENSSATPLLPLMDLPINGSASLNIGGKLPIINSHYFASAFYSSIDDYLPHGIDINQDVQLKLTNRLSPKIKLSIHFHSSNRLYQRYSHRWKYRPLHQAHTFKSNDRIALTLTHFLSESFYYNIYLSKQNVATRTGVMDKLPVANGYVRPLTDETVFFYDTGDQGIYVDNRSTTQTINMDMTYQMDNIHQLKGGFAYAPRTLDIYSVEEPWVGGTNFQDDTTFTPKEGSFFIQDKIELDYIILNFGLRWDYVDPNATMWKDINRFVEWDSTENVWVPAELITAPPQSDWSPRVGIAFPITDNTVFHFSYGHFFQTPTFDAFTYNADKDVSSSLPLVGNPKLKAQKTVSFEAGLKQALSNKTSLEINLWSKDIRDLLSTLQIRYLSNMYVAYTNSDYANVKGIDFSLDKQFTGIFGSSIAYSLSVAKGNNSNPTGGYFSAYTQEEVPHQEFYLDFDQRHDLSVSLFIKTPSKYGPGFNGLRPLSKINANLLINAGSGLPYTPYVDPTIRVDMNSARKPWTFSADLRMKKRFLLNSTALTFFLEVTNLTDYENIYFVYSRTGKPFDPGFSGVGTSTDANYNPLHIGQGRTFSAGVNISL